MTLPVPPSTAPLADGFQHVNDLRTAALAAIAQLNYVTSQPAIVANVNGDWTYVVPGLRTVQGLIIQNRGNRSTVVVVRGITGNSVVGTIYMPQVGSNQWATAVWAGTFNAQVFAWGVK